MNILLLLVGIGVTILALLLTVGLWVNNLVLIYRWLQTRLEKFWRILIISLLGLFSAVGFENYEIIQTVVGLFVFGAGLYLAFEKGKKSGLILLGLYVLRYALFFVLILLMVAAGVNTIDFNLSF